jgi:hypothetical protein
MTNRVTVQSIAQHRHAHAQGLTQQRRTVAQERSAGMRANRMFIQGNRMAAQSAALSGRNAAIARARVAHEEAEQKRNAIINSLYTAILQPLDCIPSEFASGGRALLMGHNWTDSQGSEYVVLQCNTRVPGSGKPAAVLFWDGEAVEWIDLVSRNLADLTKRGRLFLYPANLTTAYHDSFAVLPAQFENDDGVVGHWSFPTIGSFRGLPFFVGPGGYGTFVDRRRRNYLIARPSTYNAKSHSWLWSGRSTVKEENKLVLLTTSPFERRFSAIRFLVPPFKPNQPIAALHCAARDDRGDPLAIVDLKAGKRHVLVAIKGGLYLICRPNQQTEKGVPILVAPTRRAEDGVMVFAGAGLFRGSEESFEIEANDKDTHGRPVFVARANAVFNKDPMVAIRLRDISTA